MFTGLVQDVGTIAAIEARAQGARVSVRTGLAGITHGASVAVDGACLTALDVLIAARLALLGPRFARSRWAVVGWG